VFPQWGPTEERYSTARQARGDGVRCQSLIGFHGNANEGRGGDRSGPSTATARVREQASVADRGQRDSGCG
jgi:hypothetical protein